MFGTSVLAQMETKPETPLPETRNPTKDIINCPFTFLIQTGNQATFILLVRINCIFRTRNEFLDSLDNQVQIGINPKRFN